MAPAPTPPAPAGSMEQPGPSLDWAPQLVAPLDGATFSDPQPVFSWQLEHRPDPVTVQICSDSECASVIASFTADATTGAKVPRPLVPGIYYWRAARGGSGGLTSSWSDFRYFVIDAGPSPTPPPTPITANLFGVYSVATNDVYAVGAAGTLLHYDGAWQVEESPSTQELRAVWAATGGTAFAVGAGGVILRRSGTTWTALKSPTTENLYGVWGSGPSDVWAAGNAGLILHYDGKSFVIAHNRMAGSLRGVWGKSSTDVYVVGLGKEPDGDYAALLLHWDGRRFTESYVCNPEGTRYASGGWVASLTDVYGVPGGTVWAAGQCQSGASFIPYGYVAQKDASGDWKDTPGFGFGLPQGKFRPLQTIWTSGPNDVWAASASEMVGGAMSPPTMLHFDGTSWTASTQNITVGIADLGGTGASDVWAVGKGGKRLHYDGTTWTAVQ